MIDRIYIELMNKEIDGVITKTEQEKLHSYLSVNPEAQNFYDDLRQTSELLSEVPKVEPSPNIKKYVMNSIDWNRYAKAKRPFRFKSFVPSLLTKPIPKLTYAFALGILVGILVYSAVFENIITKRGMNITDLNGTIGVDEKAGFKTIQTIPIALSDINGTIAIKQMKNIVIIEADLSAQQETELLIEYDQTCLQYSHVISGSRSKITFDFGGNDVRTSSLGDAHYHLFFKKIVTEGKPVVLKLTVVGKLVYTQNIAP
jgi:hypothetical protein